MVSRSLPWFVAVGASGVDGLADIRTLLKVLPLPLRAVVLVVLHRSWDKPSRLQEVLARSSAHPILIADEGERFEEGCVYIGEPAQHLTLAARSLVEIIDDPTRIHRNRTIDLLFRSVARHGNGRMIGVVLSGSLDDGSRGLAAIHEAGGLTMVITPVSMSNFSMPESAISYDGPIDTIGTSETIALAIAQAIVNG